MLAPLTLTRLPLSSSTCAEVSASDNTRPAMNLPASSNNKYMRRIVPANAGGAALTVIPNAQPRHPRPDRGSMPPKRSSSPAPTGDPRPWEDPQRVSIDTKKPRGLVGRGA